jgi:hypothetical protein
MYWRHYAVSDHAVAEELRQLRVLLTDGQGAVISRLAIVESQMTSLVGNGQPGRITKLETAIAAIQKFRYTSLGWAGGVGASISLVIVILSHLAHVVLHWI